MITVQAAKINLTWSDFEVVKGPINDPHSRKPLDAWCTFSFDIVFNGSPRRKKGRVFVPPNTTIVISPQGKVLKKVIDTWSNAAKQDLLQHEQLHFQVGIICGRALANYLKTLSASSSGKLRKKFDKAVKLHLDTRAGVIQKAYDKDTNHSKNKARQKIWNQRMKTCLKHINATRIGSLKL